jgi:gliding motility-associated-like protein
LPSNPTVNIINPACRENVGSISVSSSLIGLQFSIDGVDYTNTSGVFSNLLPGTYQLSSKNTNGCVSIAATVVVANPPVEIVTQFDQISPICEGSTLIVMPIISKNLVPGSWSPIFNNLKTTTYTFTPDASVCATTTTMVVEVKPSLNLNATDPAVVCQPNTIDLTDSRIVSGGYLGLTYTYWYDAAATLPITNPTRIDQSGVYYIKAAVTSECSIRDIVAVNVSIANEIKGIRYVTVTPQSNEPTPLSARNIGNSYSWYPGLGIDATNIRTPTFNFNREVQYEITILADSGCVVVDTLLVKPNSLILPLLGPNINVPKAWTPNYDGKNDKLYPMMVSMKDLKSFRIFNRWGELVFETKTMGAGWDGMYKGQLQMVDVYTWMVEAIGSDGRVYKKTGSSVLMK